MKKHNFLLFFIFFIFFNASAMEEREIQQDCNQQLINNIIPDLQILALQSAQKLPTAQQEKQLEELKQKVSSMDVDYYRYLLRSPQQDMIASEAHVRAFMSYFRNNNDYMYQDKIPFDQVLDEFLDEYVGDGFENPNLILKNKEKFKPLITKILDQERENKDWFVFYHAMNHLNAFYMDIFTALRSQIAGKHILNYRTIWEQDKSQRDIKNLKEHLKKQSEFFLDYRRFYMDHFDNLSQQELDDISNELLLGVGPLKCTFNQSHLLNHILSTAFRTRHHEKFVFATNFALFANNGFKSEYTFRFFLENISIQNSICEDPVLQNKFVWDHLLHMLKYHTPLPSNKFSESLLSKFRDDLYAIYEKTFKDKEINSGRLMAIFIHPSIVDNVAYVGNHYPLNVRLDSKIIRGRPSLLLSLYRKNPMLYEFLLQKMTATRRITSSEIPQLRGNKPFKEDDLFKAKEPLTNNKMSVFFVDPQYVYDESCVKVKIHDLFFSDEQQKETYYAEINRVVSHYLSLANNENQSSPPESTKAT